MSTTPMQRPFLVGHPLVDDLPVSHDLLDLGSGHHESRRHRLHLVESSAHEKMPATGLPGIYRVATVVAALFLLLTVV